MPILDPNADGDEPEPLDETELSDTVRDRLRSYERRLDRIEAALDDSAVDADLSELVANMNRADDMSVGASTSGNSYRMTIPRGLGEQYDLTGTDTLVIRDVSDRVGERAFLVRVDD